MVFGADSKELATLLNAVYPIKCCDTIMLKQSVA